MNKFKEWLYRSRKTIGYTIGALNLFVALEHLLNSNYGLAVLWFVIASFILLDTWEFTNENKSER